MPGFGPFLGAALLVGAGDLRAFPSAGHLAAAAGLVPVPNDSGRRTGNLHRPHRYSRPLRHVFYLSAQTSMMRAGPNRDYYLKKRAHGRTHSQAVISLARRRVDVLWSLLRDNRGWVAESKACAGGLTTSLRFPMAAGTLFALILAWAFSAQHCCLGGSGVDRAHGQHRQPHPPSAERTM
jgi:hypothetical protein